MKKIILYSTRTCGFCRAAKSLLDDKGISYKEIDISSDPELRGQMMTKANGSRTVPQIFINDAHLGVSLIYIHCNNQEHLTNCWEINVCGKAHYFKYHPLMSPNKT